MDFAIVTALIFFLWLAAKKTKKLLRRLEPDQQAAKPLMIVVKASMDGVQSSHLVDPAEAPATIQEPVKAEEAAGPAFEVENAPAQGEVEMEPGEFTWEPSEEIELTAAGLSA